MVNIHTKNLYTLAVSVLVLGITTSAPVHAADAACDTQLTQALSMGMTHPQVFELQQRLNMSKDTQVANEGPGSPQQETSYFGQRTKTAVIAFQEKYASEILTPVGLTKGTGYVGAQTRKKLEQLCIPVAANVPTPTSQSATPTSLNAADQGAAALWALRSKNARKKATASSTIPAPSLSGTWGVYAANGTMADIAAFESTVGKKVPIVALFWAVGDAFPTYYKGDIGAKGKKLLIYWESSFGYDAIINGSKDAEIRAFAEGAKSYGYPVILVPFNEPNLNEEAWGYGQNGNTAEKFKEAWKRMHGIFAGVSNVEFAIAYNNVSIPDVAGNRFLDYYPGDAYVDIVGVDGFNFGDPWQSFDQVFSSSLTELGTYGKPLYILSTASAPSSKKAEWIQSGLGTLATKYPKVKGWVWFNENKERDWRVNSDQASLSAFKSVLP
jgi:beta-mannanase/peptidoglycan hydrolase-like protein with peptidoglycan-binding domain